MDGSGLGIRDMVGRSVKVSVVAGRAACDALALLVVFFTTMFLFKVSFLLSRISPVPNSKPSSKSSSGSAAGLGFGDGALGLPKGEKKAGPVVGDRGGSCVGNDVGGAGADVGPS